jgi:hypothetical protein
VRPSSGANFAAAVAEVTGLDVDSILDEMPLALARQYQHIFYVKHDVKVKPLVRPGSLKRIIR